MYSKDFHQMIGKCLQVNSRDRPTCDKILAMPGLLNHLTGTLNEIQMLAEEAQDDSLMKTIKLPRRMGEITERLPASQYETKTKESPTASSMAGELRGIKRTNSLPNYHVA
jgi:hypothetical protein